MHIIIFNNRIKKNNKESKKKNLYDLYSFLYIN